MPLKHAALPEAEPELAGAIRKLSAADRAELLAHFKRLDPESRRMRFGYAVSGATLERYAAGALGPSSVAYGYFEENALRAVGEMHPYSGLLPTAAEAALSIEQLWQDAGLGTALLKRLLLAGRNRGLRTLYMTCLPDNARMQAVARKHAAVLKFDEGQVAGEIRQPYPTPLSLLIEAMDDGSALVMSVLRVTTGEALQDDTPECPPIRRLRP
jgi:RimJ/RimL family protein N-acetyltransferase